ncbi:leucine-rich repeat domain-containing protein [Clostridium thailandense]|uniref:leucine-rich repeat domain-containing protein n=1 Tax=Clostridium thailandense TaxID=2794346 RepID=UPI00398A1301
MFKKKKDISRIISALVMMIMMFQNLIVYAAPSDVVTFTDSNLEAAIRSTLSKPTGDITESDMATIFTLDLSNKSITSLDGIQYAVHLKKLFAGSCGISDISKLNGLNELTDLSLNSNNITDISAISGAASLSSLILSSNKITDITALSGLTNLSNLNLSDNKVTDITVLSGLNNLKYLTLSQNQITDFSPISNHAAIQSLDISNSNVADISGLSGLTGLQRLNLINNKITDISSLVSSTNLNYLALDNNQITSISAITDMTNLQLLYLSNNKIADVSPLLNHTTLKEVYLSSNQITDISALSGLTNLERLYLSSNNISDISALSALNKLKEIALNNNQITDITALSGIINPNLAFVNLGANRLPDILALTGISPTAQVFFDGTYKVRYLDEINTLIEPETTKTKTIMNWYTGTTSNTFDAKEVIDEPAKTFTGYTLNDTTPKTITLDKSKLTDTIEFHYVKDVKGSTTIQYVDQDTGSLLEPQTVNSNLDLGNYSYNAKTFTDYTLNDSATKSVTLTAADKDQTIVFNYKKNTPTPVIKGSITVQHKDQDTGALLEPQLVLSNMMLTTYTFPSKTFAGYTLNDSATKSVTLTATDKDQTIVFNYKKNTPSPVVKGSYVVQYKDQDSGSLLEPEILKSNLDLGIYTENAKSFTGYTLNDLNSKTVILTDSTPRTIVFNYKQQAIITPPIIIPPVIKGSYKVQYKDQDSGSLLEPETLKSNLDLGTYTEQAKNFDGYTLNDDISKKVVLTDSITKILVFNYKKNAPIPVIKGSYVVRYVDDSGNLLAPEIAHKDLDLGTYTEQAKSFKDYKLNDESSKSITLTEANKDQVIEFKYNKIKGSYNVKYVNESGTLLDKEVDKIDLELGTYTELAKNFSGYTVPRQII